MISALLFSVVLAGAPADSAAAATVSIDDPAVQLWINNDRRFLPGDAAKVQVRTRDDGYLLVLHVDTEGHLRVLFPLDPKDDDFVRGGRKYEIRGRGGRESFTADSRPDRGTVYAAVSAAPYRLDGYVLGDHWDYRALAPNLLPKDPEAELNDMVRRMSQGDFDYDLLTYDVLERTAYSDYSTPYYASDYGYGSCFSCGYRPYGSGLSIGLSFGRPYRSYYDPYFPAYDPFYDPFFYDPYYYPAYYRPFYHPRVYYPFDRTYGYYNTPGRRFVGQYTPYRFRGNDVVVAGYRGRGFTGVRSVNTVYLPPRSRVIQPVATSPGRRAGTGSTVVNPTVGAPAARRDNRRVESRPATRDQQSPTAVAERRQPQDVEARRSGTSDGRRNATSRQEAMPQDASPLREATPDPRDVGSRNVSPRNADPRDVTPRRAEVDRPQVERAPAPPPRQAAPQATQSRREEPSRSSPPPSDARSSGGSSGGSDRGGGRAEAPSGRSSGGGGGGGQASGGGGGRRR